MGSKWNCCKVGERWQNHLNGKRRLAKSGISVILKHSVENTAVIMAVAEPAVILKNKETAGKVGTKVLETASTEGYVSRCDGHNSKGED